MRKIKDEKTLSERKTEQGKKKEELERASSKKGCETVRA